MHTPRLHDAFAFLAVVATRLLLVSLVACSAGGASPAPPSVGGLSSVTVAPFALTPAFSPSVHDYTIPCAAGANTLVLDAETSGKASVALLAPASLPAAARLMTALSVQEDQAIVLFATDIAGDTQEFWIRCLPHDFPTISVTRHPPGAPTPGYYLVGNAFVPAGYGAFAMVLDSDGTPVWYHRVAGGGVVVNVDRPSDGTISFMVPLGTWGADPNGAYELRTLHPWASANVKAAGLPTDPHELFNAADGHRFVLSSALTPGIDLTGLPGLGANSTIQDCFVQELDAGGKELWQWRASDHIDPVKETTTAYPTNVNGKPVVDVFHCNSIEVGADGGVMVSARHLDSVFFIDKATGKIVWKLGGTPVSKDGAQILRIVGDPEGAFYRQHDARFAPNGDITLFDNHAPQAGPARAVVYSIDRVAGTARFVWQYQGPGGSGAMGSFRRSPDGSAIIGWGYLGDPSTPTSRVFTEVDDAGNDLLDLAFAPGNFSYRAVKVPLSAYDLNLLRRTAGAL